MHVTLDGARPVFQPVEHRIVTSEQAACEGRTEALRCQAALFGYPAASTACEIRAASTADSIVTIFDGRSTVTAALLSTLCTAFVTVPTQCLQVISGTFNFSISVSYIFIWHVAKNQTWGFQSLEGQTPTRSRMRYHPEVRCDDQLKRGAA
jgi:hypothetical protein